MESANFHHHQLQDHHLALPSSSSSSSSSLSSTAHNSSAHGAATTPHAWTQSITLNTAGNSFHPNCNGGLVLNPRQKNESIVPSLNATTTSMIHNLGFQWNLTNNNAGSFTDHDLQLSKIKQELSDSFPRFTHMLSHSTSPSSIEDDQKDLNDLREKLLLKTISSGFPINGEMYSSPHHSYCSSLGSLSNCMPSRGNFSQIYPSINISNLNQSSPPSSSSSISSSASFHHMNLPAVDLLTFSRSSLSPHHDHNLGMYRDAALCSLDRLNPTTQKPSSCSPRKVSSYTNQITEAKRPNGFMGPKPAPTPAPKKPRVESRPSCPPFKVRKEKLGDRIAALQQLVAPFGKTDTASVLMEAIGYIKFLQNQVETLSVPYMKSSRNKGSRTVQGVFVAEDGNEEPKKDLRSRGLCLVPLSCMSYVTGDTGGGGIWPPPPNFGGGT